MDMKLELVVLPVSDIDRAKAFYEQAGFTTDTDFVGGEDLVVTDLEEALADLAGRGIEVSEPFHFGPQGQTPGLDPERRDYGSFASFSDPDGNGFLLQEVRRAGPPLGDRRWSTPA